MKVTYDPEVDILTIVFSDQKIEESDEDKPGVILDYSKEGQIVAMEILDASKMTVPSSVLFEVTAPEKKKAIGE